MPRKNTFLKTARVGLIGHPVAHSKSPLLQNAAFRQAKLDWTYELWDTPETQLEQRIKEIRSSPDIAGANVTVPHKQAVIPYLDRVTTEAKEIGAVNTIIKIDEELVGDNTDWVGFLSDLYEHGIDINASDHALILGAGGSARAVCYGLLTLGWEVTIVNRDYNRAMSLAKDMRKIFDNHKRGSDGIYFAKHLNEYIVGAHQLVVNCTSLGMHPHVDTSPWPEHIPFPKNAALYDLVYNPSQTQLMRQADEAEQVIGGIGMLVEQGACAFQRWSGLSAKKAAQAMYKALNDLNKK